MIQSASLRPIYSIIFVWDSQGGNVPDMDPGALIGYNNSCIAVSCLSSADGETKIAIGNSLQIKHGLALAYKGSVQTPSGALAVVDAHNTLIIQHSTGVKESELEIWVNHEREPDMILINVI